MDDRVPLIEEHMKLFNSEIDTAILDENMAPRRVEEVLNYFRRLRHFFTRSLQLFMWIGVILLLFGVMGILIGYLVPPRHVLIENPEYNTALDMCKLIGLILFCIGGVTLALSLLFPSFLTRYCEDEPNADYPPLKAHIPQGDTEKGPFSPLQEVIPASSRVKGVQPTKKAEQQMLTSSTGHSDK